MIRKNKRGNFKAYDSKKKQWFSWFNWNRKDLKKLCDLEGLIKFQKL